MKILLHTCCAPCSAGIIQTLLNESIHPTLYFYNPNIHPLQEYEHRKAEVKRFALSRHIECVDGDYDVPLWTARIKGLENEPERGARCQACFDLRLSVSARFAYDHDFDTLATTNAISRWKDAAQVRLAGHNAVRPYPGLTYLDRDWRKNGGSELMRTLTLTEGFYRQTYCGCQYSINKKTM